MAKRLKDTIKELQVDVNSNEAGLGTMATQNVDSLPTITFNNGANIVVNTTTGTKIGTSTSQKLAVFNQTPIVQPASADQAALSLNKDVGGADTVDVGALNGNFTNIETLVNQLRSDLIAFGIIKGSA